QIIKHVVIEHDSRPGEKIQAGGIVLPSRGSNFHNFWVHQRLLEALICIARDFQHPFETAARAGTHTSFPERSIATVARTHTGELGRPRHNRLRRLKPDHWREGGEVIEMAVDDFIGACRGLARGRERIAIVAKQIDWQVGPPSPNTPTFPAVSIEMVKLSRGCAGDDGGLAVPPDSVLSNPLVGGI